MPAPSQDARSAEQNKSWFAGNAKYASDVHDLATYRNIRQAVNEAIVGTRRLLDIGNGGVFDYDTQLVEELVGVDLFLDETTVEVPPNVTLRRGDALALSEPDARYDGVLLVSVLHHLVSSDVAGTIENMRRAIAEARRVLEPEGKLVIMESCVSARAFAVERRLFKALRVITSTRLISHPPTLQLTPAAIEGLLRERFEVVEVAQIPAGRVILQFGWRWPSALTPARPYLFTAR
jgi:SAM-dependent methyltransferase